MNKYTTEELCNLIMRIKLRREVVENIRLLQADIDNLQLSIQAKKQELRDLRSTDEEEAAYDAVVTALSNLNK
jgi:hypothetical protein